MSVATSIKRAGQTVVAAATVDTEELQRLANRREIRAELARRRLLEHQVDVLDRRIADLHQQADSAADKHAANCRPIQDRLTALETEIKTALANRLEIPAGLEEERAELLDKLHLENETLSDAAERTKRLAGPLEKERREVRSEVAQLAALESQLTGKYGNPRLLCEKFSNGKRMAVAQARVEAAQRGLRDAEVSLEVAGSTKTARNASGWAVATAPLRIDQDVVRHHTRRRDEWSCELRHAQAELVAANVASEEIRRQLLDE